MDAAEKRLVQPMPDRIALGQQPSLHFPEFRRMMEDLSVSPDEGAHDRMQKLVTDINRFINKITRFLTE